MMNKIYRASLIFLAFTLLLGCRDDGLIEHEMEVTATAYNSLPGQTSGDPNVAAWGDRLDPSIPTIAVSRDLITLGLGHNAKVTIDGMPGTFLVRDKLNKRFSKRIDIYMGTDLKAARQFGKKMKTIRWSQSP
ncbi:MAG: hypothetical protein AB8B86_19055 [Pseudomonadales bacterium]